MVYFPCGHMVTCQYCTDCSKLSHMQEADSSNRESISTKQSVRIKIDNHQEFKTVLDIHMCVLVHSDQQHRCFFDLEVNNIWVT